MVNNLGKSETPALEISALDYVIKGDREYYHYKKALATAAENNHGNDIARIHAQLDTIDA